MNKAPLGAMLLGLLHLLSALGLALCALVVPFFFAAVVGSWGHQNFHWDFGAFGAGIVIAVMFLVAAALAGAIGMGLMNARGWARTVVMIFAGIGFIASVRDFSLWGMFWDAGVIFYFTRPGVARAFR